MIYALEVKPTVQKKLRKLVERDPARYEIFVRKMRSILENPHRFKPLRGDMHGIRRVHIGGPFVLTYDIDEERQTVCLIDYDHHDNIYEKRR